MHGSKTSLVQTDKSILAQGAWFKSAVCSPARRVRLRLLDEESGDSLEAGMVHVF